MIDQVERAEDGRLTKDQAQAVDSRFIERRLDRGQEAVCDVDEGAERVAGVGRRSWRPLRCLVAIHDGT